MLLHREGAFEGDMYFDVNSDTVVRYDALIVGTGFLLHTKEYSLDFNEDEVNIAAEYILSDGSGQDDIHCRQEILVKLESV